jgi:hypothetical protein
MLQEDLARRPDNPLLLGRTVETCLDLYLLNRNSDPAQSQRWLENARQYMRPLRTMPVSAAGELGQRVDHPESLHWATSAVSAARFRTANEPRPPLTASGYPENPPLESIPGNGVFFAANGPRTAGGPGNPGNAPTPFSYPGGSPFGNPGLQYPGAPGYREAPMRGAIPPSASFNPTPPLGEKIAELRRRSREHPDQLDNLWELAEALETQAVGFGRTGSRAQEDPQWARTMAEAARLYLKAARMAPTRSQRATFFSAAARIKELSDDEPGNYAYLKLAVEEVPYSPQLWQRLRNAALRMGKIEESERATSMLQQWTLPDAAL